MSDHATWAADDDSVDYAHLGVSLETGPFTFTAAALARLARLNCFPEGERDEVLFGLRGCRIAGGGGAFAESVRLAEAEPNHVTFECTLGVWKRSTNEVAVFTGSTVPHEHFMPLQVRTSAPKCNLLLTGRYLYTVGPHLVGTNSEIRGVFKESQNVVVLRSQNDLCYKNTDVFDPGNPGDNIHPSREIEGVLFSSEGCQTAKGNFRRPHDHRGEWGSFRRLAGLNPEVEHLDQPPFVYMLLTGREARLAATLPADEDDRLRRLRFGSADPHGGHAVADLQRTLIKEGFLHGDADGVMQQGTVMALTKWQRRAGSHKADGIFAG